MGGARWRLGEAVGSRGLRSMGDTPASRPPARRVGDLRGGSEVRPALSLSASRFDMTRRWCCSCVVGTLVLLLVVVLLLLVVVVVMRCGWVVDGRVGPNRSVERRFSREAVATIFSSLSTASEEGGRLDGFKVGILYKVVTEK